MQAASVRGSHGGGPLGVGAGGVAQQVIKQSLLATAPLINNWLKHEIPDKSPLRLSVPSGPYKMANGIYVALSSNGGTFGTGAASNISFTTEYI